MASSRPTDVGHASRCLPVLSGVEVVREGRVEPFLHTHPTLSSSSVRWAGFAVEDYSIPARFQDIRRKSVRPISL